MTDNFETLAIGCPPMLVPTVFGGLTINGQRHVNLHAPDKTLRQAHIAI